MGIKLIKKTNEADLNKFDMSDVIDGIESQSNF